MSAQLLATSLLAGTAAAATATLTLTVVPRLPPTNPRCVQLLDPPMIIGCTTISALGAALISLFAPWQSWALWWVWLTLGAVLVGIDARTSWLPLPLTHVLWASASAAAVVVAAVSTWPTVSTMVLGAAAVSAFFGISWRLSPRSLGFGDVRLAPVIGAVSGSVSPSAVFFALLCGTVIGAIQAVIGRIRGRATVPLGPALWLGTIAAVPLSHLV